MSWDEKEVGVGDFVLLPQINMESFLENLKIRHSAGNIYTYIGKNNYIKINVKNVVQNTKAYTIMINNNNDNDFQVKYA